MGIKDLLFGKKKEEITYEEIKNLPDEMIRGISFIEVQKTAKSQPKNPFFQDIKNMEEFRIRNKIKVLAGFMQAGTLDFLETCKEIIEYSNKGLKINPNSAFLLYFRGRSKGDLREVEEGLKDLNKCIKINSDYAEAYIERGYLKQKIGDTKGAEEDYKKAKEIDPNILLPKK